MPIMEISLPQGMSTDQLSPILRLSDEFLEIILEILKPNTLYLLPANHKASLSVESFATAKASPHDEDQYVDHSSSFSQVCTRFRRLGLPRLYMRTTVRFTTRELGRLRYTASEPRLAMWVKNLSLLMPLFYSQERAQFEELLELFNEPVHPELQQIVERRRNQRTQERRRTVDYQPQIYKVMNKAEIQRRILDENLDLESLIYAFSKFENLQQVRLMRAWEVDTDERWQNFLLKWPEYHDTFSAEDWSHSCERGAKILSAAILRNKNKKLSRFSSRLMDPTSPLVIGPTMSTTISQLATRLKYLALDFADDKSHREYRVLELSELFRSVFSAATELECLHVGFRHRIMAPLPLIFHDIHFAKLQHIGLHMWHIDTDELIDLLRRHKDSLWSIRLRQISLKQEKVRDRSWAKVLRFIRSEVFIRSPSNKLKHWITLRGASYDSSTSAITHPLGGLQYMPVMQAHPMQRLMNSDSESDWSPSDTDSEAGEPEGRHQEDSNEEESSNDLDDVDEPESSVEESEDDHGNSDVEDYQDTSFDSVPDTALDENTTSEAAVGRVTADDELHRTLSYRPGQCQCDQGYGWDDIDDNGDTVSRSQWKEWQLWTVRSCKGHDPRPSDL